MFLRWPFLRPFLSLFFVFNYFASLEASSNTEDEVTERLEWSHTDRNALNPSRKQTRSQSELESGCKYDLSICAIFQNEGPFLKEWIEFHKIVGVQHFYLYNNCSTDEYLSVLAPYISSGEVELVDWPSTPMGFVQGGQGWAYRHCIEKVIGVTRWLAVIDVDEFLIPMQKNNLLDFLAEYEEYGGVMIFWQMYGTSWLPSIPENKLMCESLILKAPTNYGENHQVKSIVKPHRVAQYEIHGGSYKEGFRDVTESHRSGPNQPVQIAKARCNHYWTRTEEWFWNIKAPRRAVWEGGYRTPEGYQEMFRIFNSEEDKAIFRFVPELRRRMFGPEA